MEPEPKPRKLSQIAGALCHSQEFRAWCESQYGEPCADAEAAAQLIREVCGVESRALLDSNDDAGSLFRQILSDFDNGKNRTEA